MYTDVTRNACAVIQPFIQSVKTPFELDIPVLRGQQVNCKSVLLVYRFEKFPTVSQARVYIPFTGGFNGYLCKSFQGIHS